MRSATPSVNDEFVEALNSADVGAFNRMRLKCLSKARLRKYRNVWLDSSPKVRLFMGFTPLRYFVDNEQVRRTLAQDIITIHSQHDGLPLSYSGLRFTVPLDVFEDANCDGKRALFDVVYSLDQMRFSGRVDDVRQLWDLDVVLTLRDKKDMRLRAWVAVRQLQKHAGVNFGEAVSSSVSFNKVRPEMFIKDVDEYMATLEPATRRAAARILMEQAFTAEPRLFKFWRKGGV